MAVLVEPFRKDEVMNDFTRAFTKRRQSAKTRNETSRRSAVHRQLVNCEIPKEAKGPFVQLAWNGPINNLSRVFLSRESYSSLQHQKWFNIGLSIILQLVALRLGYGLLHVILAEGPVHSSEMSAVVELFFPRSRLLCHQQLSTQHSFQNIYALLLLLIYVPALLLASLVVPLWLLSLQLGAALAADDVCDLMVRVRKAAALHFSN